MQLPAMNVMSVTPFDASGAVDLAAAASHVDRLATAGVGVYLGSHGSGEGRMLDRSERLALYRVGVEAAAGRVPVVAAAAGFDHTPRVVDELGGSMDTGVDAVQVFGPAPGPVAIQPTAVEVVEHLDQVLGAVDAPVVLSNEAVMVGYAIPPDTLADVACRHANVVAVNTADSDPLATLAITRALRDTHPVYVGFFTQVLPAWSIGARGAICYEPNVAPSLAGRLGRALASGRADEVVATYASLVQLHLALMAGQTPRSVKAAMDLRGLNGGPVRHPYLPLSPANHERLTAAIHELDLETDGA